MDEVRARSISAWAAGIGSAAAVATAIIAAIGFSNTVEELQATKLQLIASNEYIIRRDARDLANELVERISLDCLHGREGCKEVQRRETQIGLALAFNFYDSVYGHSGSDGLSEEFLSSMRRDFCMWFEYDFVNEYWRAQVGSGIFGERRETMRAEWC